MSALLCLGCNGVIGAKGAPPARRVPKPYEGYVHNSQRCYGQALRRLVEERAERAQTASGSNSIEKEQPGGPVGAVEANLSRRRGAVTRI